MANEDNQHGSPINRGTTGSSRNLGFLQRPPSIHSIRSMKQIDFSLSVPLSPEGTISEEHSSDLKGNLDHDKDFTDCPSFTVGKKESLSDEFEEKDKEKSPPGAIAEIENETFKEKEAEEDPLLLSSSEDVAEHGGCIECAQAVPVLSVDEIEEGDHIVFAGAVYDHHGIVVSKCKDNILGIVEATNSISGATVGIVFGGKARIQYSKKAFDFMTDNIRVVFYRRPKFSKEKIVANALAFASSESCGSKFKYHLLVNNCEHFATFCVTGKRFSIQVRKFVMIAKLFLFRGFHGISDENLRNEKEYENKIICEECYMVNKKLHSANVTNVTNKNDVNIGDVIRYSYWNLWHDAVVLRIIRSEENYILCEIAHYGFHGPFSHREIIREILKIYFNGKVSVVHYDPLEYDLFSPKEVVERAKKRLGENCSFFSRMTQVILLDGVNLNLPKEH
ncbi:uncharacterized protein LOC134268628 isoform X2 [Saccostrea cucullata]|uniref:uncharacterized protein LOC134268628 isoform X2 n=1 Tax=Saccostrea cuccullata TaxID=36930 RepID=UPI002ED30101